nr:hypothetical protein [uncultured Duganella sp.]
MKVELLTDSAARIGTLSATLLTGDAGSITGQRIEASGGLLL